MEIYVLISRNLAGINMIDRLDLEKTVFGGLRPQPPGSTTLAY
jgi:hypothetical protein